MNLLRFRLIIAGGKGDPLAIWAEEEEAAGLETHGYSTDPGKPPSPEQSGAGFVRPWSKTTTKWEIEMDADGKERPGTRHLPHPRPPPRSSIAAEQWRQRCWDRCQSDVMSIPPATKTPLWHKRRRWKSDVHAIDDLKQPRQTTLALHKKQSMEMYAIINNGP